MGRGWVELVLLEASGTLGDGVAYDGCRLKLLECVRCNELVTSFGLADALDLEVCIGLSRLVSELKN